MGSVHGFCQRFGSSALPGPQLTGLSDRYRDHTTIDGCTVHRPRDSAAETQPKVLRSGSSPTQANAAARVAELLTDAGPDAEDGAAPVLARGLGVSVLVG